MLLPGKRTFASSRLPPKVIFAFKARPVFESTRGLEKKRYSMARDGRTPTILGGLTACGHGRAVAVVIRHFDMSPGMPVHPRLVIFPRHWMAKTRFASTWVNRQGSDTLFRNGQCASLLQPMRAIYGYK